MNTSNRFALLRRWLPQSLAQAKPRTPDPADMGTAFAMDYVLDQPPLEERPLAPTVYAAYSHRQARRKQ